MHLFLYKCRLSLSSILPVPSHMEPYALVVTLYMFPLLGATGSLATEEDGGGDNAFAFHETFDNA